MQRALFPALATAALLLLSAPVAAEQTTITLSGVDGQGRFTIFLQQTSTSTSNYVFFLKAQVTSDYDWKKCYDFRMDTLFCERDLWIAVVTPPLGGAASARQPLVAFIKMIDGTRFLTSIAGLLPDVLAGKQFPNEIPPSFRLGVRGQPIYVEPYPSFGSLFGLTQGELNLLPPGTYSFYAFYTVSLAPYEGAIDIFELSDAIVSNLDQYDIVIQEATRQCGTQQVAGGDNGDTRVFELGRSSGRFRFDYDTFSQRDRIVVRYEGKTLFDTGCVGTRSSVTLPYSGTSTKVQVDVFPNCAGGQGTQWNYTVYCAVP